MGAVITFKCCPNGHVIGPYDENAQKNGIICAICGSSKIEVHIGIKAALKLPDQVKEELKLKGGKKRRGKYEYEAVHRDDFHRNAGLWRWLSRIFDRRNDRYIEKVLDKSTGDVIHSSDEPLGKHTGHGSDKGNRV